MTLPASVRRHHRHYTVAGTILRTELELPGLPEGPPTPVGWSLRIGAGAPPLVAVTPLGEREHGGERYRLGWTRSGYRLEHSQAGCFDILFEDASITWYGNGTPRDELVRGVVLGPVMALALERSGLLCLHGSCVVTGGRAIAFLGGRDTGRSTLALALMQAGARWVSDDLLAIEPGSHGKPARVRPGAPLGAVYLLEPGPAGAEPACREPLRGADAVIALTHHAVLADSLIGLRAAGAHLRLAGEIAATAPLWRLRVTRDASRLAAVLEQLRLWHP